MNPIVYIVTRWDYDATTILDVFVREELAQQFIVNYPDTVVGGIKLKDNLSIEEHELRSSLRAYA